MTLVSRKIKIRDSGGGGGGGWLESLSESLTLDPLPLAILCLSRWTGISFPLKIPQRRKSSSFLVVIFRVSHSPWDGFAFTWTYKTPRDSPKTGTSIYVAKTPLSSQIHPWIPLGASSSIWNCLLGQILWIFQCECNVGVSTLIQLSGCGSEKMHWNQEIPTLGLVVHTGTILTSLKKISQC